MIRVYILIAAIAALGASHFWMYRQGVSVSEARNLEAVLELNQQIAEKEQQLEIEEQARLRQVRRLMDQVEELGDQANEDVTADRPAISIDGVRRLNTVR